MWARANGAPEIGKRLPVARRRRRGSLPKRSHNPASGSAACWNRAVVQPPTPDPPPLCGGRIVTADEVDAFACDGHVAITGLASTAELTRFASAIERTAATHNLEQRPLDQRDTYGKAFLQTCNLWPHDDVVRAFVCSPRFAAAAAALMGVPAVRLYHDQALFKEPRGGRTPWHQDQYYWPLEGDRTITMWMPLDDLDPAVGSMTFASGSHRAGAVVDVPISDASEEAIIGHLDAVGYPLATHGALHAGDATFHAGWTLHSAGPNPTDRTRRVMTVIYVADGTHVTQPQNPYQEFDRQLWLGGVAPGELVDSPINPILWPA